jgi:hypothetical protein
MVIKNKKGDNGLAGGDGVRSSEAHLKLRRPARSALKRLCSRSEPNARLSAAERLYSGHESRQKEGWQIPASRIKVTNSLSSPDAGFAPATPTDYA